MHTLHGCADGVDLGGLEASMKAVQINAYGGSDVLEITDVPEPKVLSKEIPRSQ